MREKYLAISSGVGACRRKLFSEEGDWEYVYDISASELDGIVVAAQGVEA
jgi:hypothetical protein